MVYGYVEDYRAAINWRRKNKGQKNEATETTAGLATTETHRAKEHL